MSFDTQQIFTHFIYTILPFTLSLYKYKNETFLVIKNTSKSRLSTCTSGIKI